MIGEPLIGLPPVVNVYQNEDESRHLIFPAKTSLMLLSLITLISTSWFWTKIRKRRDMHNNQQNVQGGMKQYS